MRRILALACTCIFLICVLPTANVLASSYVNADEREYDINAYHDEIWTRYEIFGDRLWLAQSTDEYYSFVNLINATDGKKWLDFGANLAEEELTKMRYVEILINLMTLMDINTDEMITKQANADTLKTLDDYFLDATEILVEGISISAAFGTGVTAPMKNIASTMDLTWDAAEVTINSIEVLEYVNRAIKNYDAYTSFLTAIADNTDNSTLRSAATTLSTLVGKAFYCKVDAVVSQSEVTSIFLGKEVFFDTLLLEDMLADASTFKLSNEDMAIIEQLKTVNDFLGVLEFSQDVAIFISDIVGGFSDCMNRYSEMRALCQIRSALIYEIEQQRAHIVDADDAEAIGNVCDLLRHILYVNFRGEYCFHEMVTHDGDVFSIAITKNGEETSYDELFEFRKEKTVEYSRWLDAVIPEIEQFRIVKNDQSPVDNKQFKCFADVIESVQSNINYTNYSASQKEYCRGDFFDVDGKNALVLMYHVLNGSELTPGYYAGLWVENPNGTISCLTNQLIEEVDDPDDAYVTVNIRKIDGKMYLNPYVRKANGNTDISKNQYYLIGDELVLEYNLYSEGNNYYLNQAQIEQSTFYSTQDKLNIRTFVLELNPNWSEGRPPQGYTFEELLAQLGDEAEVDAEETQGQSVFYEDGFVGNETVEQLRKSIVGSWGAEGSVVSDFDFNSDGTCYWSFDKQNEGTYQIRDDKMLVITFPWMDDRYFWTEETYEEWRSHSSQDCWYITDAGVLILNGVSYYRDGKVIKDYNTEGGLLATISGAWVLEDFMEYRFFKDGTFEENTVFVSNGMLLNRVDLDTGSIEIIDDTHAKLWNVAESFGVLSGYTELVYDPETDTLCIGGSNNVYHRAEYLD